MTEKRRLRAELRDAVTPRAFVLVTGVLVLQLGFILSYIGAFHHPTPHRIRLAVVAPAPAAQQTVQALSTSNALSPRVATSRAAAEDGIRGRRLDGALIVGPSGQDELLVASAGGAAVSDALTRIIQGAEQQQKRTVTVTDLVPANAGDARGLSAFYLAVGWVVGGYLVASILAISAGSRPTNPRRSGIRLTALGLYAVASGIGGAIIAGPALGALTGHFWAVAGFGMLLVFAVGAFTMAVQALTGIIGIGLAVLLFVVLGNPSAGGAYPTSLLPPFWRAIGPLLPPGAGTSGLRGIVYFDGAQVLQPVLVALAYAVVGAVVLVVASRRRQPTTSASA
jgi:hypothetical protein